MNVPLSRASILARAKNAGFVGSDALQEVALHQYLARVDRATPGGFLIKGAQSLRMRGITTRTTRDLDVRAAASHEAGLAALAAACTLDLGDGLLYEIRGTPGALRGTTTGGRRGFRVALQATLEGKPVPIHIDVVFGRAPTGKVTRRIRTLPFEIPGTTPLEFDVYPLEDHVADKICACIARYGGDRTSSRTKDLYDLCAIARAATLDGATVSDAVAEELALRRTTPPATFEVPTTLTQGWDLFVAGSGDPDRVPKSSAEAVVLSQSLATPAITGTARGLSWSPSDRTWL